MAFVTKKTINDETIEIIQLHGFNYAKINHQPFENIIVVCRIWFTNVDENIIKDIVIVEPSGEPKNIISEFNYLDINGNKLDSGKELKRQSSDTDFHFNIIANK